MPRQSPDWRSFMACIASVFALSIPNSASVAKNPQFRDQNKMPGSQLFPASNSGIFFACVARVSRLSGEYCSALLDTCRRYRSRKISAANAASKIGDRESKRRIGSQGDPKPEVSPRNPRSPAIALRAFGKLEDIRSSLFGVPPLNAPGLRPAPPRSAKSLRPALILGAMLYRLLASPSINRRQPLRSFRTSIDRFWFQFNRLHDSDHSNRFHIDTEASAVHACHMERHETTRVVAIEDDFPPFAKPKMGEPHDYANSSRQSRPGLAQIRDIFLLDMEK